MYQGWKTLSPLVDNVNTRLVFTLSVVFPSIKSAVGLYLGNSIYVVIGIFF